MNGNCHCSCVAFACGLDFENYLFNNMRKEQKINCSTNSGKGIDGKKRNKKKICEEELCRKNAECLSGIN